MDFQQINNIISTLQIINNQILENHSLSNEDMYILLLIIYNELILNQNTSPIIQSYIAIILYNFIELKDTSDNKILLMQDLMHQHINTNDFTNK